MLQVLADPDHEDFEHVDEWLGDDDWDTDAFDPGALNSMFERFWR